MKVKNTKKKVIKMTNTEKEEMMKTTRDIRGFFESKTAKTEEEGRMTTSDVPPSFKNLLKLAEGRGKPATPNIKVSQNNNKTKPFVPSKSAGCRPDGPTNQQRCTEYLGEAGGRKVWTTEAREVTVTRDVRANVTGTRDVRDGCSMYGGVDDEADGVRNSVVRRNEVRSVTGSVQGGVDGHQLSGKPNEPGPHYVERGGGAHNDDGGGPCGDGGGRRHLAPLNTKPKKVSGGLMARILAWERKSHVDEGCTESDTADGARLGGSNRI